MSAPWSPISWKDKPIAQNVEYPDQGHLSKVLSKLEALPPLVTPSEIERLRHQLGLVQRNEAFLLHAGDCAESFEACTGENISSKIGLILSFSLVLIWGARLPVVRIGRIAGQYAKPRSSSYEKLGDGRQVLSFRSVFLLDWCPPLVFIFCLFHHHLHPLLVDTRGPRACLFASGDLDGDGRGDNVNGLDPNDRTPDPERLLSAYFHSTTTLNYLRSLLTSGFASLHHPRHWSLSHVRSPSLRREFETIVDGLSDALDFSRTIGVDAGVANAYECGGGRGTLGEVDFYTSHEGLMLDYETAFTCEMDVPSAVSLPPSSLNSSTGKRKAFYNTGAHFLWIGDRTRQLTGAHVEYFRGIRNPIGVKVGPSMKEEELVRLLDIVNPDKEAGRVTLITRYGASKISNHLPAHIRVVQKSGHPVAWICDPMHGNTQTSAGTGLKTRHFNNIISELTASLRIHTECDSRLGGVSLEFTGELNEEGYSVTECLGGSMELSEEELGLRYQSFCDPRLNFEQSLDIAFLMSNHFKKERRAGSAASSTQDGSHLESSTVGGLYHALSRSGLGV